MKKEKDEKKVPFPEAKQKKLFVLWLLMIAVFLALSLLTGNGAEHAEAISEAMRDVVLHDLNKVSLFGLMEVNPALISAYICTAAILIAAVLIRVFVIPRFSYIPGKFQLVLETVVSYFVDLAKEHSRHSNYLLAGYCTAAGIYISLSTLFELLGVQVVSTEGSIISLSAPLADINAAIAMGVLSYLFIVAGGISGNGAKGIALALKEFSLPISMSMRLFGALLSGLLVTELVYYSIYLSFVLPVAVGVAFTLLHAVIQTYVLTMLVSIFYGEVNEPLKPKAGKQKQKALAA